MSEAEKYMQRCLQLATNGLGTTYPNPLVGSVIVKEGKIIGEGWHYQSGKPHAEVNAVNAALSEGYDITDFRKSTIYVNLEPCSHTGRTPPCANMIIENQFKKVVIGTLDPHEKVAGKGAKMIQESGIEVEMGVLEEECNELNKRFFTFHQKQRPYVILKWAQTEDGYIAPLAKDHNRPVWLTDKRSRQFAHKMRAQEHGILVGYQTFMDDNPSLSARDWHGIDPKKYVWTTRPAAVATQEKEFNWLNAPHSSKVLKELYADGIQSIIIEGGAKTLQSFIDDQNWDESYVFMATNRQLKEGIKAPRINQSFSQVQRLCFDNDILKIYRNL